MATVLVCYAAGPRVHQANQRALVASARRHGVDRVIARGPWPEEDAFTQRHRAVLSAREGAGYWLWKPRCIQAALAESAEGDTIVYADSGADLRSPLAPLTDASRGRDGVLFWNDYPNWMHVKRDCFVLLGADRPAHHHARQLDAALLVFRNVPRARALVDEWLERCTDPRLVSDAPNTCGLPNLPGFTEHRHDQAILTLLFLQRREQLDFKLYARRIKHRYVRHHRRRTAWLPIWLWHAFHDGGEAALRQAQRRLRWWSRRLGAARTTA